MKKYVGIVQGLIEDYGLSVFVHNEFEPVFFMKEFSDEKKGMQEELERLVKEQRLLEEKMEEVEDNMKKGFSVEEEYYNHERAGLIKKRANILPIKDSLIYAMEENKVKSEKEKKYLKYPIFKSLEELVMMSPAKLTKSIEFYKIERNNALNPIDYFLSLVNFSLPEFALYNLDFSKTYLALKFGVKEVNKKRINSEKTDLFSTDLPPFFSNLIDFNDKERFLGFEDYRTKSHEFISRFNNHFNKKELEQINSARVDFGENIYVLSKANWLEKTNNLNKFLVLGYAPSTKRAYLICESED